jgi:DNA-binding response OmpR family regulator
LPLCDRCGEEIALANDLDQAGDIDRRRHLVLVAGKPRRLTPNFWRLFTLLYRHRGDVVDNDRIQAELYDDAMEQPLAPNAVRENVRRLRKVLAGSRYEIVNHPTLGYELIVTDESRARARRRTRKVAEASEALSSVDATSSTRS